MNPTPDRRDWTLGPARWVAFLLLASVSLAGLGWSIVNWSPPPERTVTTPLLASADDEPVASRRIDINTASAAELELLPGIGPTLAERITDFRARSGPFRNIESLQRVRGIGPKTVEKIRPYAVVPDRAR